MQDKTALNFTNRQKCFIDLQGQVFDILIIGAGITGCGIARDAAMRGVVGRDETICAEEEEY